MPYINPRSTGWPPLLEFGASEPATLLAAYTTNIIITTSSFLSPLFTILIRYRLLLIRDYLLSSMLSEAPSKSGEGCEVENGGANPINRDDRIQSQSSASITDSSADIIANADTDIQPAEQKSKRPICQRCGFHPRTCICPSLPPQPLSSLFKRCRIVVLQHPHELRRKNRSLPLVDLCLFGKGETHDNDISGVQSSSGADDTPPQEKDFVMKTIVSRRFGDHCDSAVMNFLRNPNEVVILVFPHKHAVDLEEGIRLAEERCGFTEREKYTEEIKDHDMGLSNGIISKDNTKNPNVKKMTLVFIDATWKLAREMEAASTGEWHKNLIRVQMKPSTGSNNTSNKDINNSTNLNKSNLDNQTFIERRFHIRTPPSPDHLSTAECLAWIASRVEHNPQIYKSITRSLDYMVELWKGFTTASDGRNKSGKPGRGSMSQKKLRISHS